MAGIFEKFTEKAIKAVMLAQNFAQKMGASEVQPPVKPALHVDLLISNADFSCPLAYQLPMEEGKFRSLISGVVFAAQTSAEYLFLGLLSEEPASKVRACPPCRMC